MFISRKIRLKPTAAQEELFKQSAGVARWAYNFYLSEQERMYPSLLGNLRLWSVTQTGLVSTKLDAEKQEDIL